jgi:hypothetical protein
VAADTTRKRASLVGVYPVLLAAVLWMVIEGLPGSMLPSLLCFVGTIKAVQIAHKYNHVRYFWSCLYALSEVLLCRQIRAINNSPYYSLMMDSGTDISVESHILVYVQYLDVMTYDAKVQYLCTLKVGTKGGAEICKALLKVLDALGMDVKKLVGVATDGGSEYTGRHNGAVALLRRKIGYMVSSHCATHRAALVLGDQAKAMAALVDKAVAESESDEDVSNMPAHPFVPPPPQPNTSTSPHTARPPSLRTDDAYNITAVDALLREVHDLFSGSTRVAQWSAFAVKYGVRALKFPVRHTLV